MLDWVDPASIRFTLAFLGELSDVELPRAISATQAATQIIPSFTYRLKRLVIHPTPSQMHIPMEVADQSSPHAQRSPLQQAYRTLSLELARRQVKDKNKQFLPHLSLARTNQKLSSSEQKAVQRFVHSAHATASAQPYPARHLAVMQSEPSIAWPKYTCLGEYAFAPGI